MISIKVNEEDERRIELLLDELPSRLRTALRPAITRLTDELLQRVRASEPVRTGQLRQATQAFVDERDNAIVGKVKVLAVAGRTSPGGRHNIAAAALEYGAHRSVIVSAHTEHLTHVFSRPGDGGLVMVNEYLRRVNITAQRFLRNPATSMRARAMAELQAVIDETL